MHPFEFVNVIVTVPTDWPVTKPVLSMEAIAGSEEIHGFVVAGVPEAVSWMVEPTQTSLPVMTGKG